MSRVLPKARLPLRLLGIAVSTGLFAYLVCRAGPSALWHNLVKLSWGFTAVIALAGVSHLVKTWAWQLTFGEDRRRVSFARLVGLRLGAEAAGQFGILGQTIGDSIRVSQLNPAIPVTNSLASVTLDRGMYAATGVVTTIAGTLAALPFLSLSLTLRWYAGLFIVTLVLFLVLTLVTIRKRWPVISESARIVGRIPSLKHWVARSEQLIRSVENALFDFHHNTPKAFWTSFLLNLASHGMAVLEVYLVLWLIDANMSLFGALVIEALTKLVNVVGNFNPGNIGTYEGGNMLIGKMFGLSGATGLALGLSRRMRSLFWAAVGGICLFWLTKKKERREAAGTGGSDLAAQSNPSGSFSSEDGVAFAISLLATAARNPSKSALRRVGSLPIVLRDILSAQKTGASQIMVVADPVTRRIVQRALFFTGRLPEAVQWISSPAGASLSQQFQLVADRCRDERIVLVDGSTTYHPSLIRKASEWKEEGAALALTSAGKPAGIYAFSPETMRRFVEAGATPAETIDELQASRIERHAVDCVEVPEDLWQRVRTEEERRSAERKLDRWLVKPTDGMYAQLNRRISIPISRQLIKFPITANMVSVFTLGVGLASAAFFALGTYWYTLLGAFLCLFASILDGCDGEVARLKLLESDFGCWLETICDYLFYLFLFIGMTIGRWRSSEKKTYLVLGGLLLFGAVASFLTTGWERHRLTAGRPEQLLAIWHSHAKSRPSNVFLYLSRHMEFMVRRCFFPYALVFFALFNIMNPAFVLSAIGANLVWPMALYSCRTFAGARSSAVTTPAACA
jgi:phosphatidylglycerophosphate synthase